MGKLPCGHQFCSSCMGEQILITGRERSHSCPTCRRLLREAPVNQNWPPEFEFAVHDEEPAFEWFGDDALDQLAVSTETEGEEETQGGNMIPWAQEGGDEDGV